MEAFEIFDRNAMEDQEISFRADKLTVYCHVTGWDGKKLEALGWQTSDNVKWNYFQYDVGMYPVDDSALEDKKYGTTH